VRGESRVGFPFFICSNEIRERNGGRNIEKESTKDISSCINGYENGIPCIMII
jgi:hypothetical protein